MSQAYGMFRYQTRIDIEKNSEITKSITFCILQNNKPEYLVRNIIKETAGKDFSIVLH